MQTTESTNLLDDIAVAPIPVYPSMKQAWFLALVLFLLKNIFVNATAYFFVYYFFIIPNESFNLVVGALPFALVAGYLFYHQKKKYGPQAGISLQIPEGNNLWMLLLIVPALYVQVTFLRYITGTSLFPVNAHWLSPDKIILYLVFILLSSLLGEFIFRGVILNGLLKKYPAKTAIASAAVMAAIPFMYYNPIDMLPALPVTLFLSWLYYRSRSLVFTYICNVMLSLIPLLMAYKLPVDTKTLYDIISGPDGLIWTAAAALVFWVGIIFFNKDIIDSNKDLS